MPPVNSHFTIETFKGALAEVEPIPYAENECSLRSPPCLASMLGAEIPLSLRGRLTPLVLSGETVI